MAREQLNDLICMQCMTKIQLREPGRQQLQTEHFWTGRSQRRVVVNVVQQVSDLLSRQDIVSVNSIKQHLKHCTVS